MGDVGLAVAEGFDQFGEGDDAEVLLQVFELRGEGVRRAGPHTDGVEGDDAGDAEFFRAGEGGASGVAEAVQERGDGGLKAHVGPGRSQLALAFGLKADFTRRSKLMASEA